MLGPGRNFAATVHVGTDVSAHEHFFLDKSDPGSWRAINAFSRRVAAANEAADIPRAVTELLNVRASQLNGCAYCLDLHVKRATEAGVTAQQLAVLPAWRDTRETLTDKQFSALQWSAIAINAFNRISILSGHPVRPNRDGQ